MSNSIEQAIIKLFDRERFYAELILSMDRIIKNIPTAGVCIKNTIELHINPDFFESISVDERVAILKHECQHILNDHISRMKEIAPEVYEKVDGLDNIINGAKHKLMNVAADCAINPGISHIPEFACLPKNFDLKDGETVEWYTEQLKDNEKLKNLTEYDGHSLWSDSTGTKEAIREKLRKAIKEAGSRTRQAGMMTGEIEAILSKLNKPRNWKKDLSRFAARTINMLIESSKKKRNRRYGIMFPGSVKREELHIGVAIDTSGSISDEQLSQFMAEIGNIAKYAKVTVVEADSEVKNTYEYDPKKEYKVAGRGGTAYQPAFDYFTDNTDVDGVIYFGDMDTYDTNELKKPNYPVMWAIVGNQNPPANWGSKTQIEIKS